MKTPWVLATYYWGHDVKGSKGLTYGQLSKRWKSNATKHGVEHVCIYMPQLERPGGYQLAINYKPKFIKKMLDSFPGKSVVYMDLDMVLKKYPQIFDNPYGSDFMAFNWNYDPAVVLDNIVDPYILETAGGLMYFANTKRSHMLLDLWSNALNKQVHSVQADDRVLALQIYKNNIIQQLRCHWLPVRYFYIPQTHGHLELSRRAVIVHDHDITEEENAHLRGAAENRIPSGFNLNKRVKNQKHKSMYIPLTTQEKDLTQRLSAHGFNMKKLPTFTEFPQVVLGNAPTKYKRLNFDLITNLEFKNYKLKLPKKHHFVIINPSQYTYELSNTKSLFEFVKLFNSNVSFFTHNSIKTV